ncbi:hypothetical protein INS49_015699 [Diaporthe citri]|uniref:uncharacterized protein n=1 Tax=Diaporthe citri TaxID=83186 RepID=UPI001C7F2CA4|nr:uncharacterized protein INS49_015699 [Diaporthe citri]KAG6356312.1 hypothetical protein INS49_015699 [Diaporthe citri]
MECVDDDLREEFQEVSETDFDRESGGMSDIKKNYKLVIKQFEDYESFDRERRIHNCIRNQNGIVKCFGWYEHREKDAEADPIPYYNLVLERGTQDLYSAFQKENPPITHVEIEAFWSSLFDVAEALASIQKIDEPEGIFMRYVWHGDIKPENILDVQGRFKLADPAAPEKNTYTTEPTREIPFVTQGIDIWSLGCVFSVAATYVVAGKEGVKQYRLLRQRALRKLGLGIGDPFHDNSVLPEVTRWHQYLRTCVRTQDDYTAKVLDIVDRSMLIIPGEKRISGSDLHVSLARIHAHATGQPTNRAEPPVDILEFLDDMMASTADDQPPTLEDIPRTISQSGADMFEEALLYRSLRSEGRIPLPRHAGSPQAILGHLPKITTVLSSEEASAPVNPPITFWEVEAELEQQNKKSSGLIKSLNRIFIPSSKLMKGRDEKLAKHFVNRDLVYLVDNASTMANFWKHATYLLRVMVWRSLKLDEDGMELVFTTGKPDLGLKPKGKGHKQKPEGFVKKMDDARPDPDGRVTTNMKVSLEMILGKHMKDNSDGDTLNRGLTILVLTDGLWAANDDTHVDEYLANFIKTNNETRGWDGNSPDVQTRRRPIGIQFVRFGHHPEAIRRLQRLDDELMHRVELFDKEIPDMVDTENADGDFYKMFLGSMLEDMDNKLIQGGVGADSLSVHMGNPASAITVESSTPSSRRASNLFYPLQSRTSFRYQNDPSTHTL